MPSDDSSTELFAPGAEEYYRKVLGLGPKEPKGSEPSSTEHHRCTCGHLKYVHSKTVGSCNSVPCRCQGFLCDHTRCGWKPREEKPRPCTCSPDEACGDDCAYVHEYETTEEPPMTPEEEEEVLEDCACGNPFTPGVKHRTADPCYIEEAPEDGGCTCVAAGDCCAGCRQYLGDGEPPPPQPDRRPPYAVAYSVQGHLYEVALPGDASVKAVDGALVIQHHLGPVAGICQVLPVINEEQA